MPLVLLGTGAPAGCLLPSTQVDPELSHKRYLLGADYYGKSLIPAAQEELRQALKLDPGNFDALYLSGLIAMRQAVEAQELSTRDQCLPPGESRLEQQEADAKMTQAGDAFRKAVEVRPNFSEAWNALAAVALHFHRWDEAIESTTRALANAAYPTPWLAQSNQGVAYYEKRDYLHAAKVLREALQQKPQFCVARWRLGQVYYAQADYERASQELSALSKDRNCPIQEAYRLLGLVSLRRQDRSRAEEAFRECLRLAPKSCLAKECRLAN